MSIESHLIKKMPLAKFSTFKIGGLAKFFIEIHSIEEMIHLRLYINRKKIPFFVLGRGSNSLFDDRGFDGLVILNRIRFCTLLEGGLLKVGAGYNFSTLGTQTARKGYSGLEFASGIPGSVGGAIFMNAGANRVETCDHLVAVQYIDQEGHLIEKKKEELTFSYRFSSFQKTHAMIVSGTFQLKKCVKARKKQIEIVKQRSCSQPYGEASAGCLFRNPSRGKSAGALIESCGLKGVKFGDAEVSIKHANFIINQGHATAKNVLELAKFVQNRVYDSTGIKLEMELRVIPYQYSG